MNDRSPPRDGGNQFHTFGIGPAPAALLPRLPTLMGPHHGEQPRRRPKTGAITRLKVDPQSSYRGPQYQKRMLGSLSREWEVGPDGGPGTVSSGLTSGNRPDSGGVSYGSWQLASKRGMPQAFLRNEGAAWANQFRGLTPGTPAYKAAWEGAAAADPLRFENAQRAFVRRENYEPVLRSVEAATGIDLSRGSGVLQDMLWSTSVQHRWEDRTKIIQAALSRVKIRPGAPGFDEAFARELYAERAKYWPDTGGRYREEQAAAIRRAREESHLKVPAPYSPPVPRLTPRY